MAKFYLKGTIFPFLVFSFIEHLDMALKSLSIVLSQIVFHSITQVNDQEELDITKNRDGHIFSHIGLDEVSNKGLDLHQISMKKMHKKYEY